MRRRSNWDTTGAAAPTYGQEPPTNRRTREATCDAATLATDRFRVGRRTSWRLQFGQTICMAVVQASQNVHSNEQM